MILETEPDFQVVAEAADGQEALDAAAAHHPDVILMDLRMPNLDGIAAIERLPVEAKVLVLTTFSGDAQVYAALRAGASGYLLKTAPPEQLVAAVRTVAAGDALLDPRITRRLIQQAVSAPSPNSGKAMLSALTDREVGVLEHVARGRSNAEIAAADVLVGGDRQDVSEPGHDQDRYPQPGSARGARIRDRSGPPGRRGQLRRDATSTAGEPARL